jgi:hypothetical protein
LYTAAMEIYERLDWLSLFMARNAINSGLSTTPQSFRKLYPAAMEVYKRLDWLSLFKAWYRCEWCAKMMDPFFSSTIITVQFRFSEILSLANTLSGLSLSSNLLLLLLLLLFPCIKWIINPIWCEEIFFSLQNSYHDLVQLP